MMQDADFEASSDRFMTWLKSLPDVHISGKIALHDYTEINSGRGVVALQDIEEDELLFSIPRSALLSWQNSDLKDKLHLNGDQIDELGDWNLLILTMLYENSQSRWQEYFSILPHHFSTPMFWTAEEVHELQASSLRDKIGREEADQVYTDTIWPILKQRQDLFDLAKCDLQQFHRMGSLIMAYSFDSPLQTSSDVSKATENDEDDSEEEEEQFEKVMCPLSDLLNADTTLNNARLFHTPSALVMRSTERIARDQQVYNTYGDLPNSDLLRRYGYVQASNEHDIVELPGDCVTNVVSLDDQEKLRRVDWLLDMEILDDAFEIGKDGKVPKQVLVTLQVLSATMQEFQQLSDREESPKAAKTRHVQSLVRDILQTRINSYDTSIADDESLLRGDLSFNRRNAVIVRLSEKQILQKALHVVNAWDVVDGNDKKRTDSSNDMNGGTKKGRVR